MNFCPAKRFSLWVTSMQSLAPAIKAECLYRKIFAGRLPAFR
jgi:hypothetical protein